MACGKPCLTCNTTVSLKNELIMNGYPQHSRAHRYRQDRVEAAAESAPKDKPLPKSEEEFVNVVMADARAESRAEVTNLLMRGDSSFILLWLRVMMHFQSMNVKPVVVPADRWICDAQLEAVRVA